MLHSNLLNKLVKSRQMPVTASMSRYTTVKALPEVVMATAMSTSGGTLKGWRNTSAARITLDFRSEVNIDDNVLLAVNNRYSRADD
jgi:hypothetical protein